MKESELNELRIALQTHGTPNSEAEWSQIASKMRTGRSAHECEQLAVKVGLIAFGEPTCPPGNEEGQENQKAPSPERKKARKTKKKKKKTHHAPARIPGGAGVPLSAADKKRCEQKRKVQADEFQTRRKKLCQVIKNRKDHLVTSDCFLTPAQEQEALGKARTYFTTGTDLPKRKTVSTSWDVARLQLLLKLQLPNDGRGAGGGTSAAPDGFKVVPNYGRGDCQFLAVCQCLKRPGSKDAQQHLRTGLGNVRRDAFTRDQLLELDAQLVALGDHGYSDKERALRQKGQSPENCARCYINRMRCTGQHGGELELRDLAKMLKCPICVYCQGRWRTPYGEDELGVQINLLYTPDGGSSGHYEALIPRGSSGELKRPGSPTEEEEPGPPQKFPARDADDLSKIDSHYDALGVPKNASAKDIKSAYYCLAKTHHPDKGGVEANFQRLQHAYEILSDQDKRKLYDAGKLDEEYDCTTDLQAYDDMFQPATWSEFEGTVYAKDGDDEYAPSDSDSDSDSSSAFTTDEEEEREKADAADKEIANQPVERSGTRQSGNEDPAADEEELMQLLNRPENSANTGDVSADIAANNMAAAYQEEVDAASAAFLADEINGPQQSVGTDPDPDPDSSDGGDDEDADDDKPRSPYKVATSLLVEHAKSKGIVRFKSRKDGSVYLGKEACDFEHGICRYYEPLVDDDGMYVNLDDWLNQVMADVPRLQDMMDMDAHLFNNVLSGLQKRRMFDWSFKRTSRSIVSFANGYLDFSGRNDRGLPRHRWIPNDGTEQPKVAAVHLPVTFDPSWMRLSYTELLERCPVFAKVLQDQQHLDSCTGDLTFTDREGSKSYCGTELLVAGLGRLLHAGPFNDGMRFMLWLLGPSGTGKTDIFFGLILRLIGKDQVQIAQDGRYGDKWVVNQDAMSMSVLALQDVRGEPVTLEQLLKLINKEKVATRAMRQQASDVTPICNLFATSNTRPMWDDQHGALAGRIFEITLEQPPQLDSHLPRRMDAELHFVLLLLLRGYFDLSKHVRTTPFKSWQHPVLSDARRDQEAGHPLAEMMMDGEATIEMEGSHYNIRPETGATVNLDRLEKLLYAWCDANHRPRAPLTGKANDATVRAMLKRLSTLMELGYTLTLVNKKNVWCCKECGKDVNNPGDPRPLPGGIASTHCSDDCRSECPAGCNSANSQFRNEYKSKIKKTTTSVNPAYVKGVRVTEQGAMEGFFDDLPNGGRGAGYETPAVDNEGMRVTDIISTLPPAKVANLSPTSEVLATFDPAAAVWNDPYLRHKILLVNVHEELLPAVARRDLYGDIREHFDKMRYALRRIDRSYGFRSCFGIGPLSKPKMWWLACSHMLVDPAAWYGPVSLSLKGFSNHFPGV